MVPQAVQQTLVHGGLEIGHVQGVILLTVDTEVLDLVERNGLVLGGPFVRRFISFGEGSEGSEIHFSGRNGPNRVHDDGHEWVLEVLVQHLCGDVDTREPTAVARVGVIPTNGVLQSAHLLG